jgi:hypothetical protein
VIGIAQPDLLELYSSMVGIILMPGWAIFRPGRDDFPDILKATLLDTFIFGAIAYGILHLVAKSPDDSKAR